MTEEELTRRFKYHAPTKDTQDKHQQIREAVILFARILDASLPGESREKSLAFTQLEESQFWAHAHLARNI